MHNQYKMVKFNYTNKTTYTMENAINAGTIIQYKHNSGIVTQDRVIRVENDKCIISVPTIGPNWKEVKIHISQIVSYTNHLKPQPNC